jgi:uncharacterized protein YqeY
MSLSEQIQKDMVQAMRSHEELRLSVLRMMKSAIKNKEIDKRAPLDEKEEMAVLSTLIKQRKDSIEQFTKGGRQDLADKEAAEIGVLETYLPPAASADAIEREVTAAIAETGAAGAKDMGRVMKAVMARLAGQTVDGKAVNDLVRRKLGS